MRVFVYRNLHKNCYSVRSMKTGLVVAHTKRVLLTNCQFRVNEAGRLRVLKEGRKNVHAGIVGNLIKYDCNSVGIPVTYNPYTHRKFVCGGICPAGADIVRLTPKGAFLKGIR